MKAHPQSLVFVLISALIAPGASLAEETFTVKLPRLDTTLDPTTDCADYAETECIEIPNGRPIYALLVSGFHQNRNLDMFHWYNFAKYLQQRGAYVHYAWWNNLLAPYMERPLHDPDSVPSTGPIPSHDSNLFLYGACGDCYPNKAIPAEDYQFQQDATTLLTAIRQHNPDAIIILVGHSMGGDAVVRLADNMPATFDIDLLAPIDPVGNRTCVPNYEGYPVSTWTATCNGFFTFTRWRATHVDAMDGNPLDIYPWYPPKRAFGPNITYLYHRWQQEFGPPYDYSCPAGGTDVYWPCASAYPSESNYLFDHPADREWSIPETHTGSTNVQSQVDTSLFSGNDVPVALGNGGGGLDGHGEIVGFRGALLGSAFYNVVDWVVYILEDLSKLFEFESYPLALTVEGEWPLGGCEIYDGINPDPIPDPTPEQCRAYHLKKWEADPAYLYKSGFEPWNPGLCMVSKDLCNILDSIVGPPDTQVNEAPVADAGADQTVSVEADCSVTVTLDGSGSYDEDGDAITYRWRMDGQQFAADVMPTIQLSLGVHIIALVVHDGQKSSCPDQVVIIAVDTTAPVLTCPDDVVLECPADTSVEANGSATATDNCDDAVVITHRGEVIPGVGNTETVIRTWIATDAACNSGSCDQEITAEDTIAPELSVSLEPAVLWPPNHKMVEITASIQVSDTCDDIPTVELVSIIANERDNGVGDGNTSDDIQGADFGTDDRTFSLRAERGNKRPGRIYTVNYRAMDASGNVADVTAEVTVSHDRGK